MNLGEKSATGEFTRPAGELLLSDDMAMNFDELGRQFGGCTGRELMSIYQRLYDRLMLIRFNLLHMLCLGHIMKDLIMKFTIAESIFDDAKICEMMEIYQESQYGSM